jgi:RNA polymerase sigma factor (sigma-70 family)
MTMTLAEVERAYRSYAARLQRIVALGVRAPDAVVEDACQAAWSRLVDHRHKVGADGVLAWVAKTAVRDAQRSVCTDGRTCSIDAVGASDAVCGVPAWPALQAPALEDRIEYRQRLGALAALPVRQQRLLWLSGLGFSYSEMAAREGCTLRTVQRQLLRGRHALCQQSAGLGVRADLGQR